MREEATVPEMIICPTCGNQVDAGAAMCPACGAPQAQSGFVGKMQDMVSGILATTKTHPKHWMIGGGGVAAVLVIGAVLMFGGLFGFSDREICTAALVQAKDFGVISPSAELDSMSAKSTDVKGRRACSAKVGEDVYTLTTDLKTEDAGKKKCKDLAKQGSCVALYSVVRTDGMTTYQVREIPPEESDEALAAENQQAQQQQQQQALPGGPAPAGDQSGFETETAVDNSGMSGPSPAAPSQAPPQQ